jgi:3-hydroxyacyl-[acyl-carrier-protein] dehydratase
VKFLNFVSPGRTLTVTAELLGANGSECTFKGSGTVDGEAAVTARLVLERTNLADRNPRLAPADQAQIRAARELFNQIWSGSPRNS